MVPDGSFVFGSRAASPLVVARDLRKTYVLGDTVLNALDGVSLTVGRGEFVAIMGALGIGQIDAHEHARMSRPSEQRKLRARWT